MRTGPPCADLAAIVSQDGLAIGVLALGVVGAAALSSGSDDAPAASVSPRTAALKADGAAVVNPRLETLLHMSICSAALLF